MLLGRGVQSSWIGKLSVDDLFENLKQRHNVKYRITADLLITECATALWAQSPTLVLILIINGQNQEGRVYQVE